MMPATPKLVAIALKPIAGLLRFFQVLILRRRLLNLERCSFLHPGGGKNLPPLPNAFLQIELAELGQALRLHSQTPTAGIDALRTNLPSHAVDSHRLE